MAMAAASYALHVCLHARLQARALSRGADRQRLHSSRGAALPGQARPLHVPRWVVGVCTHAPWAHLRIQLHQRVEVYAHTHRLRHAAHLQAGQDVWPHQRLAGDLRSTALHVRTRTSVYTPAPACGEAWAWPACASMHTTAWTPLMTASCQCMPLQLGHMGESPLAQPHARSSPPLVPWPPSAASSGSG